MIRLAPANVNGRSGSDELEALFYEKTEDYLYIREENWITNIPWHVMDGLSKACIQYSQRMHLYDFGDSVALVQFIIYGEDEDNEDNEDDDVDFELEDLSPSAYSLRIRFSANTEEHCTKFFAELKAKYTAPPRPAPIPEDYVDVAFWYKTPRGPDNFNRRLNVPAWDEIRQNYPAVSHALDPMMKWTEPPAGLGKLVLWHSPPGTGKTYAIRALARAWSDWCSFEYITDPEEFLKDASYTMHTIMHGYNNPAMWRMLILEDSGELLEADAKVRQGQSLSRLLNIGEGFIGQGLNVMILITTNEQLSTVHPAVSRPGRCLQELHFPLFTAGQAAKWLGGSEEEVNYEPISLASLYQVKR